MLTSKPDQNGNIQLLNEVKKVVELGPYFSQLKLFYVLMPIGIGFYWYGIGVLTGRVVHRFRGRQPF